VLDSNYRIHTQFIIHPVKLLLEAKSLQLALYKEVPPFIFLCELLLLHFYSSLLLVSTTTSLRLRT
jgi:hypothetical protein